MLRQAFVHHGSHAIEYVDTQVALGVAHRLHAFQRAAAGKDRKPAEQCLLRGIEQAVAPVHRAAKRLLSAGQIPGAARQKVQAAFEAGQHRRRRKQLNARRRQFDRERQAIETGADCRHRRRIFFRQRKLVLHRPGALHKKRNRRKTRERFQQRHGFGVGQREWRHGKLMLTVDVKPRLARDHDFELWADRKQLRDDRRGCNEMLEVVQQQHHGLVQPTQTFFQAFLRRLICDLARSQRLRDRGSDQTIFSYR